MHTEACSVPYTVTLTSISVHLIIRLWEPRRSARVTRWLSQKKWQKFKNPLQTNKQKTAELPPFSSSIYSPLQHPTVTPKLCGCIWAEQLYISGQVHQPCNFFLVDSVDTQFIVDKYILIYIYREFVY
jgi:hypothetical protein